MTRDKEPAPKSTHQDREYEANVLDFLNKEIAASRPNQKPKTQLEEVDLLVSDLLKQAITESNQQQENRTATIENADKFLSGLVKGQAAVIDPENKNTLPDLDREFGPAPRTTAPPRNDEAKSQAVVDRPNVEASTPWNPRDSFPSEFALPERNVSAFKPSAEKHQDSSLSVQGASIFLPRMAPNRRIALIAGIPICLIILLGVGIYWFLNFNKSGSSKEGILTSAAKPAAPVKDKSAELPAMLPTENRAVLPEAKPDSDRNKAGMPLPNATVLSPTPDPSVIGKAKQTPTIQPDAKVPKEKADTSAAANVNSAPLHPAPAKEEKPEPDKSSNTQSAHTDYAAKPEPSITPAIAPTPSNPAPQETAAIRDPVQPAPPSPSNPESTNLASNPPVSVPLKPVDAVPATLISKVNPSYPEVALRLRSSASVVLEINIDANGKVLKATPKSGPAIFYNEAVKAVMKWRYKPASVRGVNVASQNTIKIDFNLK
jgi:periplasmic protein TonB